jgi:hypothetical protein
MTKRKRPSSYRRGYGRRISHFASGSSATSLPARWHVLAVAS